MARGEFPFEIERVFAAGGETYVLAQQLSRGDFVVMDGATLAGLRLAVYLDVPRALDAEGRLRQGFFAFCLLHGEDSSSLHVGQHVVLRAQVASPARI